MPKCLSMHCSFLSVICLVMQAVMIRRISGFSASRSFLQHSRRASKFAATTSTLSDEVNVEEPSEIPKSFQSSFLQVMSERGYLHQCTDFANLDRKLHTSLVSAYLGFDATAKSLHVGSLLQIMILRHLQKSGHKPVVLVGGGTTKVGDPTGKDESRKLLTNEVIQENIDSLSQVFSRFITFGDGPTDAVLVNNADWLDQLNYLNFLRDYGRLFTINRMMSFESVKQRLAREQPFSFLEFNYMLLQSYDFVELFRRHETCLQLGGSDQWGNIVSGVELGRKLSLGPLYGLTAPLITTSDGKKMGKTAAGAVWLNKELLPEYDYWQFWRNTADADVIRFLKLFTEVPLQEIEGYAKLDGAALNAVKVILADEATKLLHGPDCLASIHATVKSLFSAGEGDHLESLPKIIIRASDIRVMESSDQRTTTTRDADNGHSSSSVRGVYVVDLLVQAEMAASKGEARRLIKGGGAKVNDVKVVDEYAFVSRVDADDQGRIKLSSGKKKHALVLWPKEE